MDFSQADIDSLSQKLDALTDAEQAALRTAIAQEPDPDVAGFASLDFGKIEWLYRPTKPGPGAPGSGKGDTSLIGWGLGELQD